MSNEDESSWGAFDTSKSVNGRKIERLLDLEEFCSSQASEKRTRFDDDVISTSSEHKNKFKWSKTSSQSAIVNLINFSGAKRPESYQVLLLTSVLLDLGAEGFIF